MNLFGEHGGFDRFRDRILKGDGLNVSVIAAMIRWASIGIKINILIIILDHLGCVLISLARCVWRNTSFLWW